MLSQLTPHMTSVSWNINDVSELRQGKSPGQGRDAGSSMKRNRDRDEPGGGGSGWLGKFGGCRGEDDRRCLFDQKQVVFYKKVQDI